MAQIKIDLLWAGASESTWRREALKVKKLLNEDGEWQFSSTCRTSFKGAIEWVRIRHELSLVLVSNEFNLEQEHLVQGCRDLARALKVHHKRPWVTFATADLEYLEPLFADVGIRVEIGSVQWAARKHAESRLLRAA